jgi:isoleucyl-tRNA synthetase
VFPKRFDYQEAEPRIYRRWKDENAFRTAYDSQGNLQDPSRKDARPFVIVIPPPNITGRLHMGHALNNTVQDLLTRAKRMDGYDALWVPGTDHAGIATQTVVKKQLDAEGIDMRALGREETVRRIWEWRNKYGSAILNQLERMGCSCDWSRTRFTMDEGLNRAVRESFVRLYRDGLIYRGKRIVNWCPVDRTALSDDEVEKEDEKGKMYHIRYPLQDDSTQYMVVATTRPETLFGDVAVAVNPKDERYAAMVGKNVVLPLQGRIIPVIADEWADPEKGTGVVKITPAHDPNDFEVGQRHELVPINVMNEDATMNEVVPERYRGLDRYACRRKALEELESLGLLEETKDHVLAIGRSYRSKTADRVPAFGSVVREDGPLGRTSLGGQRLHQGQRRLAKDRTGRSVASPQPLRQGVPPLALQHPGLVHQPPDLVGPPDPGVVPQGDRRDLGGPGRAGPGEGRAREVAARRGRARHLVLLLAVAPVGFWLARKDAGLRSVLSDHRALHRQGHLVLLGGAHELRGPAL